MAKSVLRESTPTVKGGMALLIREGQGSSGKYLAEVLQRDGASAFPKGTHLFLNHLGENEYWERKGNRDIRDLVAVLREDASWNDTERGLEAPYDILPHAKDLLESIWEHVGLSIEAAGVIDDDGNVTALVPSPTNAVAIVPRAGAGGKVKSLYESYVEKHGTIGNDESHSGKDEGMKPEDIEKIAEAIAQALAPSFAAIQEAVTPKEPETPVEDEDEVDVAVVAEAIAAADLPKSARDRVYAGVKLGKDVAELVESEKAYIKDIRESIVSEAPAGTVRAAATGEFTATLKDW